MPNEPCHAHVIPFSRFTPKVYHTTPTSPQHHYQRQTVHRFPPFAWLSLSTFFTIFCSTIKKARTTRSCPVRQHNALLEIRLNHTLTQLAQRDPPYARETLFLGLETVAYCLGRSAGTPAR